MLDASVDFQRKRPVLSLDGHHADAHSTRIKNFTPVHFAPLTPMSGNILGTPLNLHQRGGFSAACIANSAPVEKMIVRRKSWGHEEMMVRRWSLESEGHPLLETLSTIAPDDIQTDNGSESPIIAGQMRLSVLELQIMECLCQGHLAIYRAVDPNTKTQVALKKQVRGCSQSSRKEHEQLLEREIQILKDLSPHPHIVNLVGYLSPHALATKFCAGGNLSRRIHDRPRRNIVTREEAIHLARHMCLAFIHIHSLGYVHRDLKSGNLLLTYGCTDLTEDVLVVNDFGLSAKAGEPWRESGTIRYAAPEVVIQKAAAHSTADVWAMGCVFVELFGGSIPYSECDNASQVMAQLVVEQSGPHIPENLVAPVVDLIASMISWDPERRPSDEEILTWIEEIR